MITPADLAKPDTEHAHQTAYHAALRSDPRRPLHNPLWQMVVHWTHAIPNGGDRSMIVASRLKAEGVKAGVWDVFVPVPVWHASPCNGETRWRHGLYLEFKKPARRKHRKTATGWSLDGQSVAAGTPRAVPTGCPPGTILVGGLSEFQWTFGMDMSKLGYHTSVCFTWEEALVETINYIEGRI